MKFASSCSVAELAAKGAALPARYPRQKVMVVAWDGYAHLVPFVDESDHYFLKTIIPSRKATRDFLQKDSG